MRRKLEEMLRLAELQTEFEFKRIGHLLRSRLDEKARHKANLCTIYIEFLKDKLNTLKKEL